MMMRRKRKQLTYGEVLFKSIDCVRKLKKTRIHYPNYYYEYWRRRLYHYDMLLLIYDVIGEMPKIEYPCSLCRYFIKKYVSCAPRYSIGTLISFPDEWMVLKRSVKHFDDASKLFDHNINLELILWKHFPRYFIPFFIKSMIELIIKRENAIVNIEIGN